ncbi:MAG: cyclic nucleotide-binding protein [Bacteroidetes bacterium 43-93]|nr:Crp/Fnr family transcriptional regulator [Bacteroidota bacterium]OJW98203.1 MAG: cyclic nucleotide-binding protein [Bacteroidetes bacterium 43-93]
MSDALKQHVRKFISISDDELTAVCNYFTKLSVSKKHHLLTEGKVCGYNYFVEKGLLRMYFVKENGVEQTTEFAMENWWLSDYTSFTTGQPSEFYIQSVERSEILAIDKQSQDEMLRQHPAMEAYYRQVHLRAHAAAQFRVKMLYTLSREEHYYLFADNYPAFVQRVPQYLLASFLGFTPEYLSEIRAKRKS